MGKCLGTKSNHPGGEATAVLGDAGCASAPEGLTAIPDVLGWASVQTPTHHRSRSHRLPSAPARGSTKTALQQVVQQEAAVNSHRVACLIVCKSLKAAQVKVALEGSTVLLQFCLPLEGCPRDRWGSY